MATANTETDLFGVPMTPRKPRETPRPPVNDMELIERILLIASDDGFVLIGAREDVYQRAGRELVERVSPEVDATVHQLIDAKWLDVGGSHQVRYDRYTGPAQSVLVPRKSRQAAYRWRSLTRPRSWNHQAEDRSEVNGG